MSDGAYRDVGAALARIAALESELEELRSEVARLRQENDGRPKEEAKEKRATTEETVRKLKDEIVNLRAENELLRTGQHPAATSRTARLAEERDDLHRKVVGLENAVAELQEENRRLGDQAAIHGKYAAVPLSDNRDAVIRRLHEERAELARELEEARARYEAEPPASRNPKTFEDRLLSILNRLVK